MSWSYIYSFTHHKNNNITIIFIQSSCKQSNKNYKMGEKLWLQMYKIYMSVMEFHPVHSICCTVFRTHTHSGICTFISTCSVSISDHNHRFSHYVHHNNTLHTDKFLHMSRKTSGMMLVGLYCVWSHSTRMSYLTKPTGMSTMTKQYDKLLN